MQMDQYLKDRNHLAVIFLLVVGFSYVIFCWTPSGTNLLLSIQDQMLRSRNNVMKRLSEQKKDELEQVLAETATANKTVVITIVNKAYVEGDKPMLDLFLDGFWLGDNTRPLLDHLLLVATDDTSYERCKFLGLHCYKVQIQQQHHDEEHVYMTPGFINMMWRRTQFLGDVLKRGYNFIFTDTDIMWLRDPFPRLSPEDEGVDLQISNDGFNGDPWSEANAINTGFFMIRSNKNTIKLMDMWYDRRNTNTSKGMKEQDVLRHMIREGVLRKLGVKVRFLDTLFFSGFCNDSRDVRLVCTVHANCCRYIKAKLSDLQQVLHDWKRFLSLPLPHRNTTKTAARFRWSKHLACVNSWKIN